MKHLKRFLLLAGIAIFASLLWYGGQRALAAGRSLQLNSSEIASNLRNDGTSFRIGAYNIAHGRGGILGESNWTQTSRAQAIEQLDRIADQINAQSLDVLVLNEVDFNANWSGNIDQANYIAERCNFPHVAKSINIDIVLPFFSLQFGNAILSKLPLQEVETIELPPVKRWEPLLAGKKNALEAKISHNNRSIRVVAIHIETRSATVRRESIEILLTRVASSSDPYVMLGDFNAIKTIDGNTAMDRLLDSGDFTTAVTYSDWKTFPSASPNRGIDWIIASPPLKTQNLKAIPSTLSDHLMVVGEISVPESE